MTNVPTTERTVTEGFLTEERAGPVAPSVIEAITRSELDASIATARRWPRSLARFRADVLAMVRLDAETAASCFYALPRRQRQEDGTYKRVTIKGPSVRLAEMMASGWGNLRSASRILAETDRDAVAQGVCHDLQTNYAVATETRRRIVDRNGARYSDDMLTVTENAACAIAWRNAVLKVIPRVFANHFVDVAMKTAAGQAKTLGESRKKALAEFAELGVDAATVCAKLERGGVDDLDLEDLALLRGLLTALREGTTTVAVEFPREAPARPEAPAAAEAIRQTVQRRRAKLEGAAELFGPEAPLPDDKDAPK